MPAASSHDQNGDLKSGSCKGSCSGDRYIRPKGQGLIADSLRDPNRHECPRAMPCLRLMVGEQEVVMNPLKQFLKLHRLELQARA